MRARRSGQRYLGEPVCPAEAAMTARRARDPMAVRGLSPTVHWACAYCHAEELAEFCPRLRCRRLYLVGDIVDSGAVRVQRRAIKVPRTTA